MTNERVKPESDFEREQALALQEILHSPTRPRDTMGYLETAGFLFAVCCNPDMVQPSEWLPEILGKSYFSPGAVWPRSCGRNRRARTFPSGRWQKRCRSWLSRRC